MARPAAVSGWRAAVRTDTRAPPEPPAMMAGVISRCVRRPASASACIADSEDPSKHTSDAPQFGRSQISTLLPCAASASASCRTPGDSLVKRPPGVITQGWPDSPMTSYASDSPLISEMAVGTYGLLVFGGGLVRDYDVEGLRGTSRKGTSLSSLRSRGMPSTRSLITLRAISVVPPPMLPAWRIRKLMALMAAVSPSTQAAPEEPAVFNARVTVRETDVPLNNRTSPAA